MTERDDAANLTGAYALNALDAAERKQLEDHIATNEQARTEVTELTDTAVMLGLAVDPVTPPPALKASIMAQLASTPQEPRPVVEPSVVEPVETSNAYNKARARWFTRPLTALSAAAAAIVLIVGGGVIANTITQNTYQQQQAQQLAAIQDAPDAQSATAPIASGGTATLTWSTGLASSVITVEGLAALPATHVYELWYIDEQGPRPAGTFTVDDTGTTWRVLEGDMAAGDTVGVTVEPRGGSPAPTTDPVVAVTTA